MRGHRGRKGIIEGGGRGGRDFSARQAPQAEQITIGGRTASLRIKAIPCRQRLLIAGSAKANAGWGRGGGGANIQNDVLLLHCVSVFWLVRLYLHTVEPCPIRRYFDNLSIYKDI